MVFCPRCTNTHKNKLDGELLVRAIHYAIERKNTEGALREIHHRVTNNLQVVSSLLNMQARAAKDKNVKDVLLESRNRVNSMALIHSQLYGSESLSEIDMKDFINKLLVQLFQSYPVSDNFWQTHLNMLLLTGRKVR